MLIGMWPGYWEKQSGRIKMRVDEDNEKPIGRVIISKVKKLSRVYFGRKLVVSFQCLYLVLGGIDYGRMRREHIQEQRKMKRIYIRGRFFYMRSVPIILFVPLYFYYDYTYTKSPPTYMWNLLHQGVGFQEVSALSI